MYFFSNAATSFMRAAGSGKSDSSRRSARPGRAGRAACSEDGGGSESISELHFGLLPGLLRHLEDWARHEGHAQLEHAASSAGKRYGAFLERYESDVVMGA